MSRGGESRCYQFSAQPPYKEGTIFRVLELYPGPRGDLLNGKLVTNTLVTGPLPGKLDRDYEALSYRWVKETKDRCSRWAMSMPMQVLSLPGWDATPASEVVMGGLSRVEDRNAGHEEFYDQDELQDGNPIHDSLDFHLRAAAKDQSRDLEYHISSWPMLTTHYENLLASD
jgi:hypothetical protein